MKTDTTKCNCGCDQLLIEIDYIRSVDMPALESKVQEACEVINRLYDLIIDPTAVQNGTSLKFAEDFIRDNYIAPEVKQQNSSDLDLPF